MAQNNALMTIDDMMTVGKVMADSGFFKDSRDMSKAVVKIMAGKELGFGPFASMTGIQIIMGQPVIGANLCAACVKEHPKYDYRVIELTNESCKLEFFEVVDGKRESVGFSEFTMTDAKRAKLTGKDNWQKWPRNMLFARAISNGIKWHCPSVFFGANVYTPDELGIDVDETGNPIINGTYSTLDDISLDSVEEISYPDTSKEVIARNMKLDGKTESEIAEALSMPLPIVRKWTS